MSARALSALLLLLTASCTKTAAATVDPTRDLDCATTAAFFRDAAEQSGAPADQRHALFVVNQWFASKWQAEHPTDTNPVSEAERIVTTIQANPPNFTEVLAACTNRANADPKFAEFARLMR